MTGPPKPEYGPRPLGEQRWRRHHGLRVVQSAAAPSPTSGCQRRRRKAIARRGWVDSLREKWANR